MSTATEDKVSQELAFLSYEPDLPGLFGRLGIKGHPLDAGRCPVAAYLKQVVGLGTITVSAEIVTWGYGETVLDLPDPVSRFVAAFDGYAYPQLVQ